MTKYNALVAGSSGLVGSHLLQQLINDSNCENIVLLVRREPEQTSSKLKYDIVDFSNLEKYVPPVPVDFVFCALGTTIRTAGSQEAFRKVDYSYVKSLADWSYAHGAKKFLLVSAMGANKNSSIFYNRVKGEAENAVAACPISAVHIFRPSLLMGERKEKRFGERMAQIVMKVTDFLFVGPLKNAKAIHASKVAAAMLQAASGTSSGVHIHLSGEMQ